jgi:hypothetical protein
VARFAAAGAATVLVLTALLYLLVWAPGAGESAAPPTRAAAAGAAAAAPAPAERGGSVGALQPPLDLAALQATAGAVYTRTPGARGTPEAPLTLASGPAGTPVPVEKPGPTPPAPPPRPTAPPAAAKPGPPQPTGGPTRPSRGVDPFEAIGTPEPEPTGTPTRTATSTQTATASPSATETATATPTPSPCQVTVPVPRLSVGVGYFVAMRHEAPGGMSVTWRAPPGGRIVLYAGRPRELPDGPSGVYEGFPSQAASLTGSSGGNPLNVVERPAGEYVALLFNASAAPLGPSDASVVYLTHGHCP